MSRFPNSRICSTKLAREEKQMRSSLRTKLQQRDLEELGFLHGTQDVNPQATQKELAAQFLVYQENVRHDAAGEKT